MRLRIACVLPTLGAALLLLGPGRAGDDKNGWKKFLPAGAYKELLGREAHNILHLAGKNDEESTRKARAAAIMSAAYTWCAKEGQAEDLTRTRATALALAAAVRSKKTEEVKKLAAALAKGHGEPGVTAPPGNLTDQAELVDLMVMYNFKSKGGDGLHPDLQINKKLKTTQNSIEELIRTLARKAPEDEVLDKAAKELTLLAYRVACNAAVTWHYTPKEKVTEWRKHSDAMRDTALSLAEAAHKKDGDAIVKAAVALDNSCTSCHSAFRK